MVVEGDIQVEPGEEEEECLVETITKYGKRITETLKKAVTHTVAASAYANDSLAELQLQNENINRIKHRLNDSHEAVTVTQKIVDSYISSISWIRNSLSWKNHKPLATEDMGNNSTDTSTNSEETNYWVRIFKGNEDASGNSSTEDPAVKSTTDPVNAAIGEFSSTATQHLDTLISELRTNRQKTQIIANTVQKQNDELEKIGDSALLLQQRVAQYPPHFRQYMKLFRNHMHTESLLDIPVTAI